MCVSQVEVAEDGQVMCRFSRPLKVKNDEISVDLNNDWFQLYAWGTVSGSENQSTMHMNYSN